MRRWPCAQPVDSGHCSQAAKQWKAEATNGPKLVNMMDHADRVRAVVLIGIIGAVLIHLYENQRRRVGRGRGFRRWRVRPENRLRVQQGFYHNLLREKALRDHGEFFDNVRMWPEQFEWLLEQVGPRMLKRSIRQPLPPKFRLGLTLKYLAHGGTVKSLHEEFRVGRSTCHSIIQECCDCIWDALQPIFLPQPTVEMWQSIAQDFFDLWQMPNCIGAIDGRHMRIKAPGFCSIVLLATCDASYKFTCVDIGQYGSMSDGGVWANSVLGKSLERGEVDLPAPTSLPDSLVPFPYYLVAEEAFPLSHHIMRPFPRKNQLRLTPPQRVLNYRLSRARRVVENAFGIMVWRWQVLNGALQCSVRKAESIVKAIVCLHNMLMQGRHGLQPGLVDVEQDDGEVQPGVWRERVTDNYFRRLGSLGGNRAAVLNVGWRAHLANYLASEVGTNQVPCQYVRAFREANVNVDQY